MFPRRRSSRRQQNAAATIVLAGRPSGEEEGLTRKRIADLGGVVVDGKGEWYSVTHVILLCPGFDVDLVCATAILNGTPIVSAAWLDASATAGRFVDHCQFCTDDEAVRKYQALRESNPNFLFGCNIFVLPSVGDKQEIAKLVELLGGKILTSKALDRLTGPILVVVPSPSIRCDRIPIAVVRAKGRCVVNEIIADDLKTSMLRQDSELLVMAGPGGVEEVKDEPVTHLLETPSSKMDDTETPSNKSLGKVLMNFVRSSLTPPKKPKSKSYKDARPPPLDLTMGPVSKCNERKGTPYASKPVSNRSILTASAYLSASNKDEDSDDSDCSSEDLLLTPNVHTSPTWQETLHGHKSVLYECQVTQPPIRSKSSKTNCWQSLPNNGTLRICEDGEGRRSISYVDPNGKDLLFFAECPDFRIKDLLYKAYHGDGNSTPTIGMDLVNLAHQDGPRFRCHVFNFGNALFLAEFVMWLFGGGGPEYMLKSGQTTNARALLAEFMVPNSKFHKPDSMPAHQFKSSKDDDMDLTSDDKRAIPQSPKFYQNRYKQDVFQESQDPTIPILPWD